MRGLRTMVLAALAASSAIRAGPALADGTGPSLEGFSGQVTTPSGWTVSPGTAQLLATNAEDPRFRDLGSTRTYALTLGLLRYTEIAGRLTEQWPEPHLRDLSFNVKLQLPLDLVARDLPLAIAVGAQDEGGAAAYFSTRYAVASLRAWRFTASVGWGLGPHRMEGLFGGGTFALAGPLELVGDWDGSDLNAGLRGSVPLRSLGLPFRLGAIAKTSVRHEPRTVELGCTLEVPLWLNARPDGRTPVDGGRSPAPSAALAAALAAAVEAGAGAAVATADPAGPVEGGASAAPADGTAEVDWDPLLQLEDGLVELGLEEVRAGWAGDVAVVEYENSRFNHDEADALQLVLLEIERVGLADHPLAIVVKRNGLRVAEISVPGAAAARADAGASVRWRYGPRERRAAWASRHPRNRSALHSRLVLAPGLRTFVGTEVGLVDWLASLRPDLVVPLWPGATAFARADVPLAWSDDLRRGGVFRRYREPDRLEHALLHQAVPLGRGLMAMVGGGLFRNTDAGGLGELQWSSGAGALALGVQGSWTANDRREERRAVTGSARVRIAPVDVVALVRAGQFVNGDRGATVELSRWFGDTQVGLSFTRTEAAVAGVFFTVPLTPRRDMRPGLLQVRGSRRWGHGVGTVVGEERNPITIGLGIAPVAPWNLEASYLDWGRISMDGLVQPVRRLPALSR